MLTTIKELLGNQYEAAYSALHLCVDRCPDANWDAPVAKYPFCQTVFHTLFFSDYYLGRDEADFKAQAFHRENTEFFADYEQLLDRDPTSLYERAAIKAYLKHCRGKATGVIAAATAESLAAPCGFPRKSFSRAELDVYNIRHIQHHVAQLSLRLRLDTNVDVPWVGSGWREF